MRKRPASGWTQAVPSSPGKSPFLFGRDADADLARHTRAAEAAIAVRVLGQILLVVILGEVERPRIEDLGRDRPVTPGRERLAVGRLGGLCGLPLGLVEHVDPGAVLGAR